MPGTVEINHPKSEIAIIAENINAGLTAFESRKAELTALKGEAEGLKIQSIEDKQGINQVSTIRKKLKNARVEIEKEGKAMRDPLTKITKSISAKEQELVAIIEPTEKALKTQEDWVKAEEARIEAEEKRREDERIQKRIDRLAEYGYAIDIAFLTGIPDDQFEKVVENAKAEYEKEEAAKTEQRRLQEEEQERIRMERAELEELRAKQAEADRILRERQEEVERKEREARDRAESEERQKRHERERRLQEVGMVSYRDGTMKGNESVVAFDVFNKMSDEEFDALVAKYAAKKKEKEEAESKARKEREEKETAIAEEKRQAEIEEARQRGIREAKEEADRKAAEEAERIAQASDKDKFALIVTQLEGINYPEMKSAKHKKLLVEVKDLQAKVIAHIKAKA